MISLYDLLEASNGQLFGEAGAQLFADFCLDASRAEEAQLFVAIKGDFGDTHQNMQEAVQNGVAGILCSNPPEFETEGITVIVVRDTEKALLDWADFVLEEFPARRIIVTGTGDRKTTVAAVTQALSASYKVHYGMAHPYGGRLALPLTLSQLETDHDFVVLDLVADQASELARLIQIVKPHVTVLTSIGPAYLDGFESIEQIATEHQVAVECLPGNGLAVLNYNDDRVRAMAEKTNATVVTVSVEDYGADIIAHNIVPGPTRTGFDLRFPATNERHVGRWAPLLGTPQLYSVLFAVAVGTHFKVPTAQVLRRLTEMESLPGRMRPYIGRNGCVVIDDTDDAVPETVLAALDWLQEISQRDVRAIVVLGDMDHLGNASRRSHRQIGLRVAQVAKFFVTEGAQAALAGRAAQDVQDITEDELDVRITYSAKDTVAALTVGRSLGEQDVVLVMGGASARMELVVEALLEHDDDKTSLPRRNVSQFAAVSTRRPLQPSWVEIDREALASNVRRLKAYLGDDVAMMATVKADAYGHGAVAVSRIAVQNGAAYLAVANISEALELRDAGIDAPILVLSYTPIYAIREAIRHNITVTVYDLDLARAFNQAAREVGSRLRVHVKIDTGMGRLGVLPSDAVALFRHLINMQYIEIEGIFTHFSTADEDPEYAAHQLKTFKETLFPIRAAGIPFKYIHASNSAGMLLGKDYHFNMARAGLIMYGARPSVTAEAPEGLQPLLTWKTVIAQVKTLPPLHPVGYGNLYRTNDYERVAVIPVGYADGFRRAPEDWGHVLVHGRRAPIRGRVSMEKTVISVNHLESASVGDEVVLLGKQGDEIITADEIASRLGTISYEVFTSILARVPRR